MISGNAVAFLICIGAGMATSLGAAVVYSRYLVQLSNRNVLAGGLGLSAGVMLYVSFIEIFVKSHDAFLDAGFSESKAYLYATLCFFAGIALMRGIDWLSHWLEHLTAFSETKDGVDQTCEEGGEIERMLAMVEEIAGRNEESRSDGTLLVERITDLSQLDLSLAAPPPSPEEVLPAPSLPTTRNDLEEVSPKSEESSSLYSHHQLEHQRRHLQKMGLLTAIAIAIHNFPEGLATFVATAEDPQVGVALAIAVAIHNIPEGLCVAVPVYYASADRHKAFLYTFLSGISEVLGGALGWVILSGLFDDIAYAVIFGMVAGMMVCITMYELIPTAHKFQAQTSPHLVSDWILVGMAIMAASLVAFKLG